MKSTIVLMALTISIPLALLAGRGARTATPTLSATACNVSAGTTQQCVLITGSGYAPSKTVTIEIDGGMVNETFNAFANRSGDVALYINGDYAPGYYTVTSYQGQKLAATTSFDVQ